ncbi:hypothetical protein PIB30_094722 [Stylosanthes scabra]|uniref:Uncharacterized protein n=1 Tax=Stylosanthes scabra TaxID=79078 RepID=A0ABU6ZU91_9FABA|nr:hypothetical protein [Stylosanthes scabra]
MPLFSRSHTTQLREFCSVSRRMAKEDVEEGCRTPRHKASRIPALKACPPAPKKKPAAAWHSKWLRIPPKSGYFNSPDLELIFRMLPPSTSRPSEPLP